MTKDRDQPEQQGKRRYNNRNRRMQADGTRHAILEALAGQLASNNTPDFSIDDAAAAAGVTRRTVFRHFPNRESMLTALADWVLEITGRVEIPQSPADYVTNVHSTYVMFADNAELMRALLLSELGRGIRSRLRERRRQGNAEALAAALSHLPAQEQAAIQAVLGHLVTAESWWQLQDTFQLPAPRAATTIAWIVQLVLEALARGDSPATAEARDKSQHVPKHARGKRGP